MLVRTTSMVLTSSYSLCTDQKYETKNIRKLSIFTATKNRCTLHRRVNVMLRYVFITLVWFTKNKLIVIDELHMSRYRLYITRIRLLFYFLANLSRRLTGELIVYTGIRRLSVRPSSVRRPSVNIFKRHLL